MTEETAQPYPAVTLDMADDERLNGEVSSQASRRAERKAKGERSLIQGRGFENGSRPMQSRSSFKRRNEEAPRTREEILRGL